MVLRWENVRDRPSTLKELDVGLKRRLALPAKAPTLNEAQSVLDRPWPKLHYQLTVGWNDDCRTAGTAVAYRVPGVYLAHS